MPKKNSDVKGTTWKKKRKTEYMEQKEYQFYIFTEGEKTEPNYFNGFKKYIEENPIYRNMVNIVITPCAAETLRVLEKAEDYAKEHRLTKAQIWCVYDKDSFPDRDFDAVVDNVNRLNQKSMDIRYHAAWSNQCFEYWFILHFSNYQSDNDRGQYKSYLDQQFEHHKLGKYQKNVEKIFEILLRYGNPKLAIRYADCKIQANKGILPSKIAPATKVYELVSELSKYLPEEMKKQFI